MSDLLAWPALSGTSIPAEMLLDRAIWGKAHAARSDFRWLAASPGFFRARSDFAHELKAGREQAPWSGAGWKALSDAHCAIAFRPSAARDAFGRGGFLEKHVWNWGDDGATAPAIAALLLSGEVAGAGALEWKGPWAHLDWAIDRFIAPIETLRLQVELGIIGTAFDRGMEFLRNVVLPEELESFFAGVEAGESPAVLGGLTASLPLEAIAALLLPLPRQLADRFSMPGRVPDAPWPAHGAASGWNGVACERNLPPRRASGGGYAAVWTRAILDDCPPRYENAPRRSAAPARVPPPATAAKITPARSAGLELDEMIASGARFEELSQLLRSIDGSLHTLVQFACSREYWREASELVPAERTPFAEDSAEARVLEACVTRGDRAVQGSAGSRMAAAKADLLRSACICLSPSPRSTIHLDNIVSPEVAPLLFATQLRWDATPQLGLMGYEVCALAIQRSLGCRSLEHRARMMVWLDEWPRHVPAELARWIAGVLAVA